MKRKIIILIIALMSLPTFAQKVLNIGDKSIRLQSPMSISDTRDTVYQVEIDTVIVYKNVERRSNKYSKYPMSETFFALGMPVRRFSFDESEQLFFPTEGSSVEFQAGFKKRYRLARWYSIGAAISYTHTAYVISEEDAEKFLGREVLGDAYSHKLLMNAFGLEAFNRFNVGRSLGLEFGVYGDIIVGMNAKVKTRIDGKKEKYKNWDDDLNNNLQYGAKASIIFGEFSVYAKYRLSDIFYSESSLHDPTRLNVGLMLSF